MSVDQLITTWIPPRPPGIYAIISATGPALTTAGQGVVAIAGEAATGPLGSVQRLGTPTAVASMYGSGGLVNAARNAALGGAIAFVCIRVGSGGAAAQLAVNSVGTLAAGYPGVDGNTLQVIIRPVLGSETTQKELVVLRGTLLIQTTRFAVGGDEVAALAAASAGQPVVFTPAPNGGTRATSTVPALSQTALSGGTDPTVASGDYTSAFGELSAFPWRCLVTDSETSGVHSSIVAYLDNEIKYGRFRFGAVGQPTSVPLNDRLAAPAALNSAVVRYVGNGFLVRNLDGTYSVQEGYLAAAFDAGLLSTFGPGDTLNSRVVPGAADVVGAVDVSTAIDAGMGYYTYNSQRGVRTGKGRSTLTDASRPPIWALELHEGWADLQVPATAFGLLDEVGANWSDALDNPDPRLRPPNNDVGRETLCALADRVANAYIAAGWLLSGRCIVDPAHPPTSDTAWFTFDALQIGLRVERLVLTLPFVRG